MSRLHSALALSLLMLILSACAPAAPSASPRPLVTPTVTLSPVPTDTATSIPSSTAQPTRLPTAGPSPTVGPTPHPASDQVWYRDDRLIVYTLNNHLCALEPEKSPIYLADPSWIPGWSSGIQVSSDDRLVAFIQRHETQQDMPTDWDSLWVVGADGTGLRKIVDLADFSKTQGPGAYQKFPMTAVFPQFFWQDGTHHILFTTGTLYFEYNYNGDLNMVDVDSGIISTILLPGSDTGWINPSPDGQVLMMTTYSTRIGDGTQPRPATISFINVNGTEWHRSVFTYETRIRDNDMHALGVSRVWTKTQNGVRIVLPAEDPIDYFSSELVGWIIPADGTAPSITFRMSGFHYDTMFGAAPAVSPDGRHLLYSGEYGGETGVYVFDTQTGDMTQSDPAGMQLIDWDRDSSHFTYFGSGGTSGVMHWRGEVGGASVPVPSQEIPTQDCVP